MENENAAVVAHIILDCKRVGVAAFTCQTGRIISGQVLHERV
jgi:hypothetical protein